MKKRRITKTKKKSKATIMTPVAELSPSETNVHYSAVMIEEIRSSQKLVIEHMDGVEARLERKIEAVDNKLEDFRNEVNLRFKKVDARFDILEAAIKCNADGIRELQKDMKVVKTDIRELQGDMKEVKSALSRIEPLIDNHEERLNILEPSPT